MPVNLVDRLARTGLGSLATSDPGILNLAERELARQRSHLNLVAASSPTSPEVLAAQGLGLSALTAEGYPGRRYHPGTEVIDEVEQLAVERAQRLFGADHANVQPLSASWLIWPCCTGSSHRPSRTATWSPHRPTSSSADRTAD